ncbi:ROK family transcriptional regulator [Nocardioides sp. Kera G14]|uniref:ROK family transcriptional regulator n=1 Tax=Nocardioides sp. Kera G14 TaxID=2884264 RepID=UPI001D11E826|nr:ROK family transcriptional regulator [Nocardioides sp. Kera G14]UDY24953.1 ROK family transcriptional regulator [Nocardioides sp. Kera G14]
MVTRSTPLLPVQHAGMRASNLALVLGAIADHTPATRAQVAVLTGLTKSSVSGLVADLLAARLVAETSTVSAGDRGRPGTALALSPQGLAGLGLEINVDYLAAMLIDLTGTVRYRHVVTVDNRRRSAEEVQAAVAELATAAAESAREQGLPLAGASLAVPGVVEPAGVVRAPNLGWSDVTLVPAVPDTPLGTTVHNEADLAALGELWTGEAGRDFVHVSAEIGIGSGIVLGGELFRGSHGRAGELGHLVLDAQGPECSCGGRGCLERLAGQEAILAAAGVDTPEELYARCVSGDTVALEAVAAAGEHLGVAIASVTNLLDPGAIVLGGLFAELSTWLLPSVGTTLRRHGTAPRIVVSRLGTEAAVRGAAGSVVRRVVADPASYLALRSPA